jgi:acyl carrier protein
MTEKILAEIWSAVLGVENVGINDNFFELGGHSLLVTKVLGRLREAIDIELPMRAMFEAPTIAELAKVVESVLMDEVADLSEEEAERLDASTEPQPMEEAKA